MPHLLRITEIDAMGRAHVVGTGRQKPLIHPVVAEVALPGHGLISVEVDGAIGTRIDARPAPRTFLALKYDDSVAPLEDGLHRTGLGTGRIIAVPT